MTEKLLTFAQVADRLGIGESTVRRMVWRDEFVRPLILSKRRIAFRELEVEAWIASRPRGCLEQPASLKVSGK